MTYFSLNNLNDQSSSGIIFNGKVMDDSIF